MCKCGVYTLNDFQDECRKLWCDVVSAYATDGMYQEKMSSWGDTAVAQFTTRYSNTVGVCKCKVDNNETN